MKRPIEPSEIRKGDRVMAAASGMETAFTVDRIEGNRVYSEAENAVAFLYFDTNDWFLLDRPEPVVELPTEPTAGWIDTEDGRRRYDHAAWWSASRYICSITGPRRLFKGILGGDKDSVYVTAFTPATAAPTEALDALREAWDLPTSSWQELNDAILAFLAAVDEANA